MLLLCTGPFCLWNALSREVCLQPTLLSFHCEVELVSSARHMDSFNYIVVFTIQSSVCAYIIVAVLML